VTCTVKVCVVTLLYPYTVAYYTVRFYRHKFGKDLKLDMVYWGWIT